MKPGTIVRYASEICVAGETKLQEHGSYTLTEITLLEDTNHRGEVNTARLNKLTKKEIRELLSVHVRAARILREALG